MKIIVHRESMLRACQFAALAVCTRDVKPILKNAKLETADDRATLMATDLEIGVRLDLRSIKVEEPGITILPLAIFTGILRNTTDDELTVELEDKLLTVRGHNGRWEMPTEDPAAFPDVPEFNADACHEIKASILRDIITKTSFAHGDEDSRFSYSAVMVEAVDSELAMVATDGHCLARMPGVATHVGEHSTKGKQRLVSPRAIGMVRKEIDGDDECLVRVCLRDADALFKTERTTIYTRLIERRFPKYENAVPKGPFKVTARLPVGRLLAACRQAAVMLDKETKRLIFDFKGGKLTISASAKTTGESAVELAVEHTKPLTIWFDRIIFTDMLPKLAADSELLFEAVDKTSAVKMTQGNFLYAAVPLHLEDK